MRDATTALPAPQHTSYVLTRFLILRVLGASNVPLSGPDVFICIEGLDGVPKGLTLREVRTWLQSHHHDVECAEFGGWRVRAGTTIPPTDIAPTLGSVVGAVPITAPIVCNAHLLQQVDAQSKTIRMQAAQIIDLTDQIRRARSGQPAPAVGSTGNVRAAPEPAPRRQLSNGVREVIAYLHQNGPTHPNVIAERFGITVLALRERFARNFRVAEALIEYIPDESDRRQKRWVLRQPVAPWALAEISDLVSA